MGVVEGGQDRAAAGVDDAGAGADQRADVGVRAHRDDQLTLDRNRCGRRPAGSPDHSVQDHQRRDAHGSILRGCQNVAMKVETDVARAHTLPSSMYTNPAILEQEKERIFSRTWQLVAHSSELARVGDFKPVTILDEPILITHAQDGRLRGFYNVCRHRAAQVVTTRGNRKSLQCGYHGWVY